MAEHRASTVGPATLIDACETDIEALPSLNSIMRVEAVANASQQNFHRTIFLCLRGAVKEQALGATDVGRGNAGFDQSE